MPQRARKANPFVNLKRAVIVTWIVGAGEDNEAVAERAEEDEDGGFDLLPRQ